MEVHDDAAGVQRSLAQIARWQGAVAAKVYAAPRPEWSPPG
jgi:hypothetical protein